MNVRQSFDITFPVTIRPCREDDLRKLEWFGSLRHYRQVINDVFFLHKRGDVVMLVADADGFPVGQVWVDLVTLSPSNTGAFWALRVLEPFQNRGLGTRLIKAAEACISDAGLRHVELGVETNNPKARRLYEHLGYKVIEQSPASWSYTTPDGEKRTEHMVEWIMRKDLEGED